MLNDIRPRGPVKPVEPVKVEEQPVPVVTPLPQAELKSLEPQPIEGSAGLLKPPSKRKLISRIVVWVLVSMAVVLIGILISAWLWFNAQTAPISTDKQILIPVTIKSGATPSEIGKLLADKSLIRSSIAFDIYTHLSNNRSNLQAGSYRLSPAESTQAIVGHLINGKVDQFQITFYPGATLAQHKKVLLEDAHFSEQEIDDAFAADYSSLLLFAGKPAYNDLEGYIYGETYYFNQGASVKDILKRTFEESYKDIQDNNLIAGFNQQGLNLYQAITLASIVQREASTPQDQKQVAQVFLSRLKIGMVLGSDVTYQYIADKLGVARDVNLNNPYNTRRFAGLPPGPIASPSLNALKAVASPAEGSYLYFLAGDDGTVYFAYTNAEHEVNKAKYCITGCSQP